MLGPVLSVEDFEISSTWGLSRGASRGVWATDSVLPHPGPYQEDMNSCL